MRLALGIEYDGSRFLGWQTQPGGGTVQDVLQAALAAIAGEDVPTGECMPANR
jgi:tRNA pseudouridine38-40 synthase